MNFKRKTRLATACLCLLAMPITVVALSDLSQVDRKLLKAVAGQDIKGATLLLAQGASPNASDEDTTALMIAATAGNLDLCRLLIEKGANVQAKDHDGDTALEAGYASGSTAVVKFLISKGAKVNKEKISLTYLVSKEQTDMVRLLIELGANVNERTLNESTPLIDAAAQKSLPLFQLLMEKGADPKLTTNEGVTALMMAAKASSEEMVRPLLERKVDPNARDKNLKTALQYAAGPKKAAIVALLKKNGAFEFPATIFSASLQEDPDAVNTLLTNGVNANQTDDAGRTALHLLAKSGKKEMVRLLLSNGANPNAKDKAGKTPLDLAKAEKGESTEEIIDLLRNGGADAPEFDLFDAVVADDRDSVKEYLDHGVSIEATNETGRTPLMLAIANTPALPEMTRLLLERGAKVNVRDHALQNPMLIAVRMDAPEIVKILLEHGADANAMDESKSSVLMNIVGKSYDAVFHLLLEHGANIKAKDVNGSTVMIAAARSGTPAILRLLMDKGAAADLNAAEKDGTTPLHAALQAGLLENARFLLECGADPNTREKSKRQTPLMAAVTASNIADNEKSLKMVEMLLKFGAQANAEDDDGATAAALALNADRQDLLELLKKAGAKPPTLSAEEEMTKAIQSGSTDEVSKLLDKGFKLNETSTGTFTPLALATLRGETNIMTLMLDKGANPNRADGQGSRTPLGCALEEGNIEAAELLIKRGAKVSVNSAGQPPLVIAILKPRIDIVKMLLAAGADVNAKGSDDVSPLIASVRSGRPEFFRLILSKGPNVNFTTSDGDTALHEAAQMTLSTETINALVEKGAKIEARTKTGGNTPLHIAAALGNLEAVKALIELHADLKALNDENKTPLALAQIWDGDIVSKSKLIALLGGEKE